MDENIKNTNTEEQIKNEEITREELREMIEMTELEAKEEKRNMPSPRSARLTYSAYSDMRPCKDSIYSPVGILSYTGMLILFGIPVIGLFASIIFACISKKLAVKHLSAAVLIIKIVSVLLLTAFVLIFRQNLIGIYNDIMAEFSLRT